MSDSSTITIYWKSGRVTDVSFPDPPVREPNMVSSEIEFRFDDITDGLFVSCSCHVCTDVPESDALDGVGAQWRAGYTMRLLGPGDLKQVDSIYFRGQEVVSALDPDQPPISLMKLNRLAELYLDRASSLASYSLISQVADALSAARDLDDDEDGYVALSDAMGLETDVIRHARSFSEAMQSEDGLMEGSDDAESHEVQQESDAEGQCGSGQGSPAAHGRQETHISFSAEEEDDDDDMWI